MMASKVETSLCLECGVDTMILGYVNRVSADRDNIDGWICGMCISTWDLRDMWDADGKQIYCPAKDEDEPEINEDTYDDYEYGHCDEAEEIHIKQWHPEVDKQFPKAPQFRNYMETEYEWSQTDIWVIQEFVNGYNYEEIN